MTLNVYGLSILSKNPLDLILPVIIVLIIVITVIILYGFLKQKESLLRAENLLASQKNLKTVLDALPVPVRITDMKTLNIVYVNDCFVKVFELNSADDIIGKPVYSFVANSQNDGKTGPEKLKDIVEAGGKLTIEIKYQTAKDNTFDAQLISCYIDYNGVPCSLGIVRDLTAEKKSQKILFNAVKKEKGENQLKNNILQNLNHEIKTPMNAIISLTEAEMNKTLTQETLQIFKMINTSAKNLLQIIDDSISLSDLDLKRIILNRDEFELDDVLNSALLVISQHFQGNDNVALLLNTSLDLPRFIIGDKMRLWQVLKGFLDNSAKYTKNGRIVLSVSSDNDPIHSDRVFITFMIKDTGTLEGREQSLTGESSEYSSSNHAVFVAKKICNLMEGESEIEFNSTGALIRFTIPFLRSTNTETTMQAINTPMLSGLNILLVDDDELSLKIMERLLKCSNVNCVLARGGSEALDIVSKYRDKGIYFDVILLDYMMEDLDGLAAAAKIHLSLFKLPKIIIVTAYHKQLLENKIERNYVDEIIEKPFVPSQFIQKICAVLGPNDIQTDTYPTLTTYKNVCVLICEDNIINQEITASMLEEFGISYIIADNGKKAVEILNNGKRIDLVLMDLYMPIMDGFEATRIIRQDSSFDNIPIISQSADTVPALIEKAIEMGMNGHLPKPIEFDALNTLFINFLPESKRVNQ